MAYSGATYISKSPSDRTSGDHSEAQAIRSHFGSISEPFAEPSAVSPLNLTCRTWVCAMASLATAVALLQLSPDLFTVQPNSVVINETRSYLGIYFTLRTQGILRIRVHLTIAHWKPAAVRQLTPNQTTRLLNQVRAALALPLRFADSPPIDCGHRFLLVVHVATGLSQRWWGIQQSAASALGTTREQRRENFHMSIDALG